MTSCALISISHRLTEKKLARALENTKKLGFTKIRPAQVRSYYDRWSGTPKQRIASLHKAFDQDVACIRATSGGSGVIHLLDQVDYTALKNKPKFVIGYSDLTPLLNNIYEETGIIALHGPMALRELDEASADCLKKALAAQSYSIPFKHAHNIPKNPVKGILKGGNLALCTWSLGADFEIDLKNKVVFFEEVGTNDHIAYNRLMQLRNSKHFKPKALLFGYLDTVKDIKRFSKAVAEAFSGIPIIYNLPFGHQLPNLTIPIGAKATLDFEKQSIDITFPKETKQYAVNWP